MKLEEIETLQKLLLQVQELVGKLSLVLKEVQNEVNNRESYKRSSSGHGYIIRGPFSGPGNPDDPFSA